jgi:predicted peptidase
MKYAPLALLALAILFSSCSPTVQPTYEPNLTEVQLQAKFEVPEEFTADAPADVMKYLVWLPDGFHDDSEKTWPLIFFLHGSGSDESDSAFVMSSGLPEVLYTGDQPDDFPFVVVSPQAFAGLPWWGGVTPDILMALLDEVTELYQIDQSRLYLTGLSMGGYGSWLLTAAYGERFAAMVSTSGTGYGNVNPTIEQLCKVAETPIWAFHGARDVISDPIGAKMYITTLESECDNLVELKWTLYPEDGHLGTYQKAYRDPELYAWLLEHSLDQ